MRPSNSISQTFECWSIPSFLARLLPFFLQGCLFSLTLEPVGFLLGVLFLVSMSQSLSRQALTAGILCDSSPCSIYRHCNPCWCWSGCQVVQIFHASCCPFSSVLVVPFGRHLSASISVICRHDIQRIQVHVVAFLWRSSWAFWV